MQGWKLNKEEILDNNPSNETLWECFDFIFSNEAKKQSTYKYGFLRSILENLDYVDKTMTLTYDQIFYTFTRIYWPLVIKHNLSQTDNSHPFSAVEKLMHGFQKANSISEEMPFDSLPANIKEELCNEVKKQAKRNVVGALWGDSDGILYAFSTADEKITISEKAYAFMQRYKQILLSLNNDEWARFLQKYNSETITSALDSGVQSDRKTLEYYRRILDDKGEKDWVVAEEGDKDSTWR